MQLSLKLAEKGTFWKTYTAYTMYAIILFESTLNTCKYETILRALYPAYIQVFVENFKNLQSTLECQTHRKQNFAIYFDSSVEIIGPEIRSQP